MLLAKPCSCIDTMSCACMHVTRSNTNPTRSLVLNPTAVEEMWNAFRGHTHVPTGVLLPRNNWLRVIPGSNPTGPAAVAASHARPRQKPSAP